MATFWRSTNAGWCSIVTAAEWVQEQAARRNLTVQDYIDGRVSLTDLGVTADEAAVSLKPLIPCAHEYYCAFGPRGKKFTTWEAWFSNKLRNRIYYFFHKHGPDGKIVRAWAEWPLEVPEAPDAFSKAA